MKAFISYIFTVLILLSYGCAKDPSDPHENPPGNGGDGRDPLLTGIHYYAGTLTTRIGAQSETIPDGQAIVDFDNGSFTLNGWFEMSLSMAFDAQYTGKKVYQLTGLEDAGLVIECSDKALNDYDWQSGTGSLEITENTADNLAGTYQFMGDGGILVEGSFNMSKKIQSGTPLEGFISYKGSLVIKCGSQSETVQDGEIDVDFDFDTRSFSLTGGDDMSIDISFDDIYKGVQHYPFAILENRGLWATCTNKNDDDFDWTYPADAGFITITENTAEKIVGIYEYKGRDFDDNSRTVKGSFSMVKQ